jgi:hypothetical protein
LNDTLKGFLALVGFLLFIDGLALGMTFFTVHMVALIP